LRVEGKVCFRGVACGRLPRPARWTSIGHEHAAVMLERRKSSPDRKGGVLTARGEMSGAVDTGSAQFTPLGEMSNGVTDIALIPTIFHQPWWLDIATRGQWAEVECIHNGSAVGRMPYLCRNRLWFKTSDMPMLSHFLGPAVNPGGAAPIRAFCGGLPSPVILFDSFRR
jgi:hypothetical protein